MSPSPLSPPSGLPPQPPPPPSKESQRGGGGGERGGFMTADPPSPEPTSTSVQSAGYAGCPCRVRPARVARCTQPDSFRGLLPRVRRVRRRTRAGELLAAASRRAARPLPKRRRVRRRGAAGRPLRVHPAAPTNSPLQSTPRAQPVSSARDLSHPPNKARSADLRPPSRSSSSAGVPPRASNQSIIRTKHWKPAT